jgi:hypothetical protein
MIRVLSSSSAPVGDGVMVARLSSNEKAIIRVGTVGTRSREWLIPGPLSGRDSGNRTATSVASRPSKLDELLNRWPAWDVDDSGIKLAPTSIVRG